MKESRFIELLNLYVDQQLSAVEAAELEAEISKNPVRRRTYQQYCRMQKACNRLFEEERAQAPGSVTLSNALLDADRKIVAFPNQSRSRWQRGVYVAGLMGAAACVAFVVSSRVGSGPSTEIKVQTATMVPGPLQNTKTLIPAVRSTPVVAVSSGTTGTNVQPKTELLHTVFTPRVRRLTSVVDASDPSAANDTLSDRASFDWMQRVNLQPLRRSEVDDLAFESRPVAQPENRIFTGRRPVQSGTMETIGFQFTR
jgi:anti-sigma factor RsiW